MDWELARRIAVKVAGEEPLSQSYLGNSLHSDFARFTPQAEELVSIETGLFSKDGKARAKVIDRAGWINANIKSFQRLLRPILVSENDEGRAESQLTKKIAATELGLVLGWMSRRVLGQYDLLLAEDEDRDDQDYVYYVGPNILSVEKNSPSLPNNFDFGWRYMN